MNLPVTYFGRKIRMSTGRHFGPSLERQNGPISAGWVADLNKSGYEFGIEDIGFNAIKYEFNAIYFRVSSYSKMGAYLWKYDFLFP